MPTGFLTTAEYWVGNKYLRRKADTVSVTGEVNTTYENLRNNPEADNFSNDSVYQFVSPEVAFQSESFYSQIKDYDLRLNSQKYLFSATVPKDWRTFYRYPIESDDDVLLGHVETEGLLYYIHPGTFNTNIPCREKSEVIYLQPDSTEWTKVDHNRLHVCYYAICTRGSFYNRLRQYVAYDGSA
jgi:hypothetical protein